MLNRNLIFDIMTFRGIKGYKVVKKVTNEQIGEIFKQLCDDMISKDECMNEKFYNNIPLKTKRDIIASIDNVDRLIQYFIMYEVMIEE